MAAAASYFRDNLPEDLPEDLMVKILLRLPINHIVVCKCVRKSWCHLIESPRFIETHCLVSSSTKSKEAETTQLLLMFIVHNLRPHRRSPGLYILPSTLSLKPASPSPWEQLIEFPKFRRLQCSPQHCRGLVCLSELIRQEDDKVTLVVVNPVTREFRELPKLDRIKNTTLPCSYVLFDQSSNSFKVLWLCYVQSRRSAQNPKPERPTKIVYVINLVNDVSWRKVVIPNDDDEEEHECWVFPSLHHGIPYKYSTGPGSNMKILVFDTEHEDFRISFNFLHVSEFANSSFTRTVAACIGSIYIFLSSSSSDKVVDVWVMKDYKTSKVWVKETSCELRILYEATSMYTDQFESSTWEIAVHGVIGHHIIIKVKRTISMPTGVCDAVLGIYDTINKRLQRYEVADKVLAKYMEEQMVIHAEFNASLVSPNRGY